MAYCSHLFPVLGFLFYALAGSGLSYKTRVLLKKKRLFNRDYQEYLDFQKRKLQVDDATSHFKDEIAEMIIFNINNSKSACFLNNDVKVFVSGKEKIAELKKDLLEAKHSINMLYYIFADDKVGRDIMRSLIKKAKEGVKVNFVYDSIGCIKNRKKFYDSLKKAGGRVHEFFPPMLGVRMLNFKMNYRNHRKITVIDGKIGYTGGINIRDDHMGDNKKLAPWRDTHIRIEGEAVYGLQTAFFNDWRYCQNEDLSFKDLINDGYFPKYQKKGDVACQVVSSGPEFNSHRIKDAYIKMISLAKRRICIQTPYFVPDDCFMSSLRLAINSGVKVDIMIPALADKKMVHLASLSFIKEIMEAGANIYLYNGFIHSKTLTVDNNFVSIGTTNMDNRSFALNFEINAFLYDKVLVDMHEAIFNEDIKNSVKINLGFFRKKKILTKIGQTFFRIFAPLL